MVRAQKVAGLRFRELIYGETPLLTSLWVLARAGAGRGRLLVGARWLGAEAVGIELLYDHVERVAGPLRAAGIQLVEGDMTQVELSKATHLFTNWLAFSDETKARMVERFRTCPPGTRILTVLDPIEAEDFVPLSWRRVIFTWGPEPVWTYAFRPEVQSGRARRLADLSPPDADVSFQRPCYGKCAGAARVNAGRSFE